MPGGKLDLRVVSPSRTGFQGEVSSLVLPAWDGRVGILPGHAPYVALLGAGGLEADLEGGGRERIFVHGGVVRVEHDHVTVLSEYADSEPPEGFSLGMGIFSADELTDPSDG